jgi:general secretion pathway protein G
MGRSIVTGKLNVECGVPSAESTLSSQCWNFVSRFLKLRTPHFAFRTQKGFSLLELMIAMFIMIILLSIAVPTYERSVRHARELVLKENLFQMRRSIDQFRADKGKLPASIDDLVTEKYLREKPIDPILEKAEWNEVQGEDSNSPDGESGLVDVKTTVEGQDSNGVDFGEY